MSTRMEQAPIAAAAEPVPVARPRLPSADEILPYLRAVDSARVYSNHGPLARRLEARLAQHFGLPGECVALLANATLGLALALGAVGAEPGRRCLMPAWTFVATAHAGCLAGLQPGLADVGRDWALDPAEAAVIAARDPSIGAVMPVMPFGRPLDPAPWDALADSGLPVVIDAAAGFDALTPGRAPAVVSLHATKVLGIGEGAFAISTDPAVIERIRWRAQFGFPGRRESVGPGTNAKLSEYGAAVGLAALDRWPEDRADWMRAAASYRAALAAVPGVRMQDGLGTAWVSSTLVVALPPGIAADAVSARLAASGIDSRAWWGQGIHRHAAFADLSGPALPVTEHLARTTIGLPFHPDLTEGEIARVAAALGRACRP